MTFDKFWRKSLKHVAFIAMSAAVAHIFISYFVSLPKLWEMMHESPLKNISAFLWVFTLTGIMYFNFAWFREQMCMIICPYGRLQSVMTDLDTIIIGYDEKRGEPRGKKADANAGDCVDCSRCFTVCPTGIDIRNGLQLDCIGCAACVDACDEIMVKLGRSPGLIRYDSMRGLSGEKREFWRPRLGLYAFLAILGLAAAFFFGVRSHQVFEANLMRLGGTPYFLEDDGRVQNLFEIHVVNKKDVPHVYEIKPSLDDGLEYVIAIPTPTLKGGQGMRVPIFVYSPSDVTVKTINLDVSQDDTEEVRHVTAPFLRPH
ncbi:MAG: 4Fe-4S dicluster domain-containing protein [Myxococcales bacterium]|nr:4Fe-4S dicluster domain-containing protein [Myxococcales bacterium]